MSSAYIPVHFKVGFITEANNMSPDQTDLGLYCLQYTELWYPCADPEGGTGGQDNPLENHKFYGFLRN